MIKCKLASNRMVSYYLINNFNHLYFNDCIKRKVYFICIVTAKVPSLKKNLSVHNMKCDIALILYRYNLHCDYIHDCMIFIVNVFRALVHITRVTVSRIKLSFNITPQQALITYV